MAYGPVQQKPYRGKLAFSLRGGVKMPSGATNAAILAKILLRWGTKETALPHSSTVQFLAHWRSLQSEGPAKAPLRTDFDPSQLKTLMPQMIMISTNDTSCRFRLSGGLMVALHGHELKDTAFSSLFANTEHDRLRTALLPAVRQQQPVTLTVSAPWHPVPESGDDPDEDLFQTETVTLEITLCPLTNSYGKIDRLVGLCQPLSRRPKNTRGSLGRYTLLKADVDAPPPSPRKPHLQLVAVGGRRIA
jgi:hypothetical protein